MWLCWYNPDIRFKDLTYLLLLKQKTFLSSGPIDCPWLKFLLHILSIQYFRCIKINVQLDKTVTSKMPKEERERERERESKRCLLWYCITDEKERIRAGALV